MATAREVEALRHRLLYDTPFYAEHCLWIVDKQRRLVRLKPLPWQARTEDTPADITPLDEALEKQRAAGQPMRAIILKSRKLGFCLAPETRVLTADLRWVTIDSVRPGDRLLGCDEEPPGGGGSARKMREVVVEARRDVHDVAYRVVLDNGATVTATAEHRFLARWGARTEARWRTVAKMKVGDRIRHVARPWGEPAYEDGWFGGMIDGEGSLRPQGVTIYQRPGAVFDRAVSYLDDRGYASSQQQQKRNPAWSDSAAVTVRLTSQMLRLVGMSRPSRFVGNPSWWEGRELPYKDGAWPKIVEITPLPAQRMVDLQTDRKTFVAEGLVSHNSTWAQAKAMQRVTQMPFQSALTVAHRGDAAAELFDMALRMYERLPSDPQLADLIFGEGTVKGAPFSVRPQKISEGLSRTGVRHLELGSKQRRTEASVYRTLTAGAKGGGRAATPNIIHASEYGHWEDPDYGVGLFNAMPLEPETIGVVESTANGFNHFQSMWARAVAGAEDEDMGGTWIPLFYGWQHNPFNRLAFVSDRGRERFESSLGDVDAGGDPEELELVEAFGVTLEQLNWRRAIINGPEGGGNVEWFHQEHPATPEQAFIGSGKPVFPGILVARAIREAEASPRPVEGVLRGADWRERKTRSGTVLVPERALWVPGDALEAVDSDRWGATRLKVWAHPLNEATQAGLLVEKRKPDSQHVLFADIAIGQGGTAEDGDWHAFQVFDHLSRRQVASYRSRVPVHEVPLLLYLLGLYYNEAWLAVEVNGPGGGVVDALAKDYRYRMLYRRHRAGDDERTDTRERLIGWLTTQPSKYLMEQTFGEALKEGWHGIRDVPTAREFSTYVQDPKRPEKHGAQRGANDDLAISAMGAHRVMAEMQPRREKKASSSRRRPVDDVTGY